MDPKNVVKRRAVDRTEVTNKFWQGPKDGRDRLHN